MAAFAPKTKEEEEKEERTYQRYTEIMSTLPRVKGFWFDHLYQHQGFWYPGHYLPSVMAVQNHFITHSSDILLATNPKCGTTWLKSLIFAICNRKLHPLTQHHPLLSVNSHQVVPFLENHYINNQIPNLDILPSPRILAMHMPYSSLPPSVLDSCCPIVYICRNPKDAFVSMWHFMKKMSIKESTMPSTLEDAFEMFCNGASNVGPFWDHVLEYWRASLDRPQCVMFLKYEEMKAEATVHVKRLAEFIRCPFSLKEQKDGVVDEIIRLCSFENLSNLDVNKTGGALLGRKEIKFHTFFRKGKVGDSSNYLTPEMIERLDRISEQKFHVYGLTLS